MCRLHGHSRLYFLLGIVPVASLNKDADSSLTKEVINPDLLVPGPLSPFSSPAEQEAGALEKKLSGKQSVYPSTSSSHSFEDEYFHDLGPSLPLSPAPTLNLAVADSTPKVHASTGRSSPTEEDWLDSLFNSVVASTWKATNRPNSLFSHQPTSSTRSHRIEESQAGGHSAMPAYFASIEHDKPTISPLHLLMRPGAAAVHDHLVQKLAGSQASKSRTKSQGASHDLGNKYRKVVTRIPAALEVPWYLNSIPLLQTSTEHQNLMGEHQKLNTQLQRGGSNRAAGRESEQQSVPASLPQVWMERRTSEKLAELGVPNFMDTLKGVFLMGRALVQRHVSRFINLTLKVEFERFDNNFLFLFWK